MSGRERERVRARERQFKSTNTNNFHKFLEHVIPLSRSVSTTRLVSSSQLESHATTKSSTLSYQTTSLSFTLSRQCVDQQRVHSGARWLTNFPPISFTSLQPINSSRLARVRKRNWCVLFVIDPPSICVCVLIEVVINTGWSCKRKNELKNENRRRKFQDKVGQRWSEKEWVISSSLIA